MNIPITADSVIGRILPALSLFGNRDLKVDGRLVTKQEGRLSIRLTPSFFRKFTCPDTCQAICCRVFDCSLDFCEKESAWQRLSPEIKEMFSPRVISVGEKSMTVYSLWKPREKVTDRQDRSNIQCSFLQPVRNGNLGCSIWETGNPLECGAAYNMRVSETPTHVMISKQGLGRAWRYPEPPQCEFEVVPVNQADLQSNIDIFKRYIEWAKAIEYRPAEERLTQIISRLGMMKTMTSIHTSTFIFN